MVKAYVQLAFIADFPKKRNSTDRENTVPRSNLIPSETLEYLENRGSEQKKYLEWNLDIIVIIDATD